MQRDKAIISSEIKREEGKNKQEQTTDEQKTNSRMVDPKPAIPIIIVNVNAINF